MFYIVWRNQQGEVGGFIQDENEMPTVWVTEQAAKQAMNGHILEHFSEVIEL